MDEQLAQLLAMLGVSSVAEASAAITRFNTFMSDAKAITGKSTPVDILDATRASLSLAKAIETATNKTGDDAVGLVRAALQSHAELPKAQARVEELESTVKSHELESIIAKAKAEKKCTPSMEANVREAFAAGDVTLAGARSWLENAVPISALQPKAEAATASASAEQTQSAASLTWNGKSWDELKPAQRAELKRTDPELFAQMRQAALQR